MNKRVLVKSFSGIAVDPTYMVGWDDIYLELHWPKRHKLYLAPTFMTRDDLVGDINRQRELAKDKKWKTSWPDFESHAFKLQAVLDRLDKEGVVVDAELNSKQLARSRCGDGDRFALAGVYTSKEWIDRAEAERMITHYIGLFGVRDAKYVWIRPRFFVNPVSIHRN